MDFPTRLRKMRRERNYTQEQLGRLVSVTKVSISCYENGSRTPEMETLQRLADALDVSVDYLLGRTDEQEQEEAQVCQWVDEILRAPKEYRDELRKIWDIIKMRGAGK